MTKKEMIDRTEEFALAIIELVGIFPKSKEADIIGYQLIRSGCSVGANYRAACRAQSRVHFVHKLKIVLEEADESQYWLELANARKLGDIIVIGALIQESDELAAIFVLSINTARRK
jgi:four helix bundle protein